MTSEELDSGDDDVDVDVDAVQGRCESSTASDQSNSANASQTNSANASDGFHSHEEYNAEKDICFPLARRTMLPPLKST